jgi:pantoate--beta-alanine ligase
VEVFESIAALRSFRERIKEIVCLVPTMGYLHEGHCSLIKKAQEFSDRVFVSLFVNPTQFNSEEDFALYPRNQERDLAILEKENVCGVFVPKPSEMYLHNHRTNVDVKGLSEKYEGLYRPGHFQGVATVVNKLLNIVIPDYAFFGEKDFQQIRVIETMVKDLEIAVKIIRCPIIRDNSIYKGLALSSRNERLSHEEKLKAMVISHSLYRANELFQKGERDVTVLKQCIVELFQSEEKSIVQLEYTDIVDEESLTTYDKVEEEGNVTLLSDDDIEKGVRIIIAAYVNRVRLIDTLRLSISKAQSSHFVPA